MKKENLKDLTPAEHYTLQMNMNVIFHLTRNIPASVKNTIIEKHQNIFNEVTGHTGEMLHSYMNKSIQSIISLNGGKVKTLENLMSQPLVNTLKINELINPVITYKSDFFTGENTLTFKVSPHTEENLEMCFTMAEVEKETGNINRNVVGKIDETNIEAITKIKNLGIYYTISVFKLQLELHKELLTGNMIDLLNLNEKLMGGGERESDHKESIIKKLGFKDEDQMVAELGKWCQENHEEYVNYLSHNDIVYTVV